MQKQNLASFLRLVIIAFCVMFTLCVITSPQFKDCRGDEGQPALPRVVVEEDHLLDDVDAMRITLIENGTAGFAPACLSKFERKFEEASKLTGMPVELLAGIAGYESAGCTIPKGPGNVMHVTFPGKRHVQEASRLLGVTPGMLAWKEAAGHSTVLGAVMLSDYAERRSSLVLGISAYRHGMRKASYNDAYTRTVLAHSVLARRWRDGESQTLPVDQNIDLPFLPQQQGGYPVALR